MIAAHSLQYSQMASGVPVCTQFTPTYACAYGPVPAMWTYRPSMSRAGALRLNS